jgi:hypothetical protein
MDKLKSCGGLVNLLLSSVLGAGLLMGNTARADSFSRILGTSLENAGYSDSGNYFKSVADNEDAYQAKKKLEELKEIEEKRLKLEEENKKAREAKEIEAARIKSQQQRKVNYSQPRAEEPRAPIEAKRSLEDELSSKIIFTFNRWIDLNEDQQFEYNELQGVKNSFTEGEELHIIIQNQYTSSKFVRHVIYGPAGDKLCDWETIFNPKMSSGIFKDDRDSHFKPIFTRGGVGSYKAAVYFDNKLVATHDFEIKSKSNN